MYPARSARAFTLFEAMLASAILALIVAALCQAVTAGQLETAYALHATRATFLADAWMEEVLAQPYDQMDDRDGDHQAPGAVADATGDSYPTAYQDFDRQIEVVTSTVDGIAGRLITVTVEDDQGQSWHVKHFVPEPTTAPSDDGNEGGGDEHHGGGHGNDGHGGHHGGNHGNDGHGNHDGGNHGNGNDNGHDGHGNGHGNGNGHGHDEHGNGHGYGHDEDDDDDDWDEDEDEDEEEDDD